MNIEMLQISLLGMPGGPELILIAFVILLLFGGKKLPELMKGLGKGIKEFNNAKANIETEVKESMKEIEKAPRSNREA
jgi:sec-independent protein translocase protein TatA